MTYKTKPHRAKGEEGVPGGRQLVSVGPYKTAVPDKRKKFIVIGKAWDTEHASARSAATGYVNFVGRDRAWDSLQKAKCRRR